MSNQMETSSELQDVVLSSIMKDSYLLSKVSHIIEASFFEKSSYKMIYKSLQYYYDKYKKKPTTEALLITLSELHTSEYGDIGIIKDDLHELSSKDAESEDFVIDNITKFIRRRNIEDTLSTNLGKIKEGNSVAIEQLGNDLLQVMNVDIMTSRVFTMDDAEELQRVREESVGTGDNSTLIRSVFPDVNKASSFGAYKPGDLVMVVSPPGTGKTMMMINECKHTSVQGFNALHIFVGDMLEYDGFIRYLANVSGIEQSEIVAMDIQSQSEVMAKSNLNGVLSRIDLMSYAANEISMDQLIEEIFRVQENLGVHYDMIAVDYPDNLTSENDMMYKSGGDIYNKLSYLARRNKSVVIAGSQPQKFYWDHEIIPLEAAAESSKKQHVIDYMITIGRPYKSSTILTGHLPKVRRGTTGGIFRIGTQFGKARMGSISEQEYNQIKLEEMGSGFE